LPQTDADIFLRRPGGGKQARPPGRWDDPHQEKCRGAAIGSSSRSDSTF